LTLREPGAPARQAEVAPAARHLAGELPAGPVRDRLATVLGVRALLPRVRVRSRTRSLALLNRDAKTVVRLEVEQGQVVGDGRKPAALSPAPALGCQQHADDEAARQGLLDVRVPGEPRCIAAAARSRSA
jgi:hypothetical protein